MLRSAKSQRCGFDFMKFLECGFDGRVTLLHGSAA
jgi:hypothetical protein